MAAPVVVLLAVTLLPQPLDPEYQSIATPLGLCALEAPLLAATDVALGLTVLGVLVAAASLVVVRFRRALPGFLVESLKLCAAGMVKVGVVALNGTKLAGNASDKAIA